MEYTRKPAIPPVIAWFDDFGRDPNPYAFLSNFYVGAPLVFADTFFSTGEHLFQWLKLKRDEDRAQLAATKSPSAAKALGRSKQMRADWEAVKYDAMRLVLSLKFTLDRPEGVELLATGDALLVEGTWWADRVWGVDLSLNPETPAWRRPGRNWLGALLMARRAELRAEATFGVSTVYADVADFAEAGKRREAIPYQLVSAVEHEEPIWKRLMRSFDDPVTKDEHEEPVWKGHLRSWIDDRDPDPISVDDALEAARSHRLDHSGCDHADSANARRRCRRRWLRKFNTM